MHFSEFQKLIYHYLYIKSIFSNFIYFKCKFSYLLHAKFQWAGAKPNTLPNCLNFFVEYYYITLYDATSFLSDLSK